jgi:hypothetical protein
MARTPNHIPELHEDIHGMGIDPILGHEGIMKDIEIEKFAHEEMEIMVHESNSENDLQCFMLNVNGINQPIVRGMPQNIKRKYVEALARAKTTRYTQRTPNPSEPDRIHTVPHTALSYPFSVIHDPNPRGAAWLKAILAER